MNAPTQLTLASVLDELECHVAQECEGIERLAGLARRAAEAHEVLDGRALLELVKTFDGRAERLRADTHNLVALARRSAGLEARP